MGKIIQDIPNYDALNSDITGWLQKHRALLRTSLNFHTRESTELVPFGVKTKTKKLFGLIDNAGFIFKLTGIWKEKGVGRGRPIDRVSTSRAVLSNGAGTATKWFSSVLTSDALDDLADIVTKHVGDATVEQIQF